MKKFLLKNKIVISVVAVVLTLGVFGIAKADSSLIDKFLQIAGIRFADNLASKIDVGEVSDQLIGGTNPDFQTNWYRFGGVMHVAQSMSVTQASSTVCRLQGPVATSTLVFASAFLKTATTTATYTEIAKSTNAASYATTTSLGIMTVPANGGYSMTASSSLSGIEFKPNEWIVVKVAGGTGSTGSSGWDNFVPTGFCKAEWIQLDE